MVDDRHHVVSDDPDPVTGHHPHWVKCERSDTANRWFFTAFDRLELKEDATYELCGEKVQGNKENIIGHELIRHGIHVLHITDLSFDGIKEYLSNVDIEGIVFHHETDSRMCKIRKSDFGIKR